MKRILFLFLIGFSTYSLYAQKVVVDGGRVVIDSRNVRPEGITSKKKANRTTATNSTVGTPGLGDIASVVSNAQVYNYFEVAKSNSSDKSTWLDAINKCATLTDNGGGWRLPTQRELMLIQALEPQLTSHAGFAKFGSSYLWSATEYSVNNSWYVRFSFSGMRNTTKTSTYEVRCVRDLTPPVKAK